MSFNLVISKEANFFNWLKNAQSIPGKEKELWQEINRLLISDKATDVFRILVLETNDTIWQTTEELIGKQKTAKLKKSITPFEEQFLETWPAGLKSLQILSDYYRENNGLFDTLVKNIRQLCDVQKFETSNISIHLLLNSGDNLSGWFSYTSKRSDVVIECSQNLAVSADDKFPIAILSHEFFHLILRENIKFAQSLKEMADRNNQLLEVVNYGTKNLAMVLEELVISSFIPEGYLAEKILNLKMENKTNALFAPSQNLFDFSQTRKICAFFMYETAKEYMEKGRTLDAEYLKILLEITSKHLKNKKE